LARPRNRCGLSPFSSLRAARERALKVKKRIDQLLVERSLAETRSQAQALVLAGQVLVAGQKVDKPGHAVAVDAEIRLLERLRYASRGGLKLEAALEHFRIVVAGRVCMDLGASTGGFTDCLLQRGARAVHTFDVGRGLLAWKLRTDPRVTVRDGFNVRHLAPQDVPPGTSLVTIDLAFISVTKVLPALQRALASTVAGDVCVIVLVKPQFEVGKGRVGKGGIVRDPEERRRALNSVEAFATSCGCVVSGSIPSPIAGAKGNEEFLLALELSTDLSSKDEPTDKEGRPHPQKA
jgi:23S rRNA (cytidine1920-2'-O)/16S rRNA (cytidine1409-2'-O)-methyltransferase